MNALDEAWQDTIQEHQAQLNTKRHHLATTRFQSHLSSLLLLLLRFHLPTPNQLHLLPA